MIEPPVRGWSYSSLYKSLAGAAIFDLPRSTARIHDPAVATFLEEVVAGRRDIETVADEFDTEAHRRFAGPADVVAYVQLSTADDDVALRRYWRP